MSTRKLIVGYHESPGAHLAAEWALDEAARTGARVEFCHAYQWPVYVPPSAMAPAPTAWPDVDDDHAVEKMLEGVAARAAQSHPHVAVSTVVEHAPAAVALIDRSAEADLMVLGGRRHPVISDLLGTITVIVGTHARCPVVIVRGSALPTDPIVVGAGDRDRSDEVGALAFAFEQAAGRGTSLRVIRAWLPPALDWTGSPAAAENQATYLADLVQPWRGRYPDVPVTTEVVVGNHGHVLAERSLHAQLVVVGDREHRPLPGSVSRHLLHHAASSVAIVRKVRAPARP